MRGLLILGTDTGVGKTALGCGLLRLASRKRQRLVPFKPAETDCSPWPTDALRLRQAAVRPDLPLEDVCPYPLPRPLAPSVAARLVGTTIAPERLATAARTLLSRGEALLVESAGGVLTPYAAGITSLALATLFDIDVLLVGANRLGTINHTALALDTIARCQATLAGFVLVNVSREGDASQAFNAAEIETLTGVKSLGTLRHCPATFQAVDTGCPHDPRTPVADPSADAHADALADAVAADLDLAPLFGGTLI